ncbi:hypothetical protein EJ131_16030 [Bacillus mycoides]|nr:hypothetical protein [Bacillus mycoides]
MYLKVRKPYLYRGNVKSPSSYNFIVPPERNFVLTCNKKAHFFVFGLICFLKLMGMWQWPI